MVTGKGLLGCTGRGGLPSKKNGGACWKFKKELLRSKILFCGRGLKFFSPLRGTYSKTAH